MVSCKCAEAFNCTKPVNITANLLLPNLPSSVEGDNYYLQLLRPKIIRLVFMIIPNSVQVLHIFLHGFLKKQKYLHLTQDDFCISPKMNPLSFPRYP